MSAWMLEIHDGSGEHTCDSCTKRGDCCSKDMLDRILVALIGATEDPDVHPDHSGWGQIAVTCRGYSLDQEVL